MPLWHPLLAATPSGGPSIIRRPFGINARTSPTMLVIADGNWDSLSTSLNLPLNGQLIDINDTLSANAPVRITSLSFIRFIKLEVSDNIYDQDVDFVLFKNGTLFQTLFTISAGAAGEGSYTATRFIPMQNDDVWSYGFITSVVPNGQIVLSCTTDIQYGQGAITNIRGDSNHMVFSSPEIGVGGLANRNLTRYAPMTTFVASQLSGNESEFKEFTAYRRMSLGNWFFEQTRSTGSLATMLVRFLINGVVRFTLSIANNETILRETPLTVETFPGSGVFVPIILEIDDTVSYQVDGWAGEATNPIREFMTGFDGTFI